MFNVYGTTQILKKGIYLFLVSSKLRGLHKDRQESGVMSW